MLTKANVGKAIAIVLDGVVYSAPRVNGEIDGCPVFYLVLKFIDDISRIIRKVLYNPSVQPAAVRIFQTRELSQRITGAMV